jgi:D-3-phosphoglycerate dehydrogenase
MKILAVGDAFITADQFQRKCSQLKQHGHEIEVISWGPRDRSELENIIRGMEKGIIPDDESLNEIKQRIIGKDALFVDFCPVPASLATKVKLIGVTRSGINNIDLKAAEAANVKIIHINGRNAVAVAEFTIGLILSVSRNIAYAHHDMMNGHWKKVYAYEPVELEGKRVGLIGFGEIGRCVARKLASMGCETVYYDPYYTEQSQYAESMDFINLLETSDYISIHTKLNEETKHLVGAEELKKMKKTAFIINTARAEIIDSSALLDALRRKVIAGAALDVFPVEPLSEGDELLELDNVVLTSHIAGSTPEALDRSIDLLIDKFLDA